MGLPQNQGMPLGGNGTAENPLQGSMPQLGMIPMGLMNNQMSQSGKEKD